MFLRFVSMNYLPEKEKGISKKNMQIVEVFRMGA